MYMYATSIKFRGPPLTNPLSECTLLMALSALGNVAGLLVSNGEPGLTNNNNNNSISLTVT